MEITYENNSFVEACEIKNLFRKVGWNDEADLSIETLELTIKASYIYYTARNVKGDLVGFIRSTFDGMYAILWNLVVDPNYKQHGIGIKLVKLIMIELTSRDHHWICAFALNDRLSFYSKMGLHEIKKLAVLSTYPKF